MDPENVISEIMKTYHVVLKQRLNPVETVPYMFQRGHFTKAERDKVDLINRNDGQEPANVEIIRVVERKLDSFVTLVASVKVNRDDQLYDKLCVTVKSQVPGLLEKIRDEVLKLLSEPTLNKNDTVVGQVSGYNGKSNIEVLPKLHDETHSYISMPPSYEPLSLEKSKDAKKNSDGVTKSQEMKHHPYDQVGNQLQELEITNDTVIKLDDYNCDLHLVIDPSGYIAEPLVEPVGFCYLWAGVRCTHGVCSGQVYFEVKVLEELPVEVNTEETHLHVLRVGWSKDRTSFQLGEEPDSYGYGGTGKFSCNNDFTEYGEPFTTGDVICAMLDLHSQTISYMKNGKPLGVAMQLRDSPVGDRNQALFPHILTKNTRFQVNFGQQGPWYPPSEGFRCIMEYDTRYRIRGLQPPKDQSSCEVIMIIGLPGSGKTTWAVNKAKNNPGKRYNILGTDNLIDVMRVTGLPRTFSFNERFIRLMPKASECMKKLLEIGKKKIRNFIIDQTNVYPGAQKGKMKKFQAFYRKAVVVVPCDVELIRRSKKRTQETGKFVKEEDILDMKAHFKLPLRNDDSFHDVEYVELAEENSFRQVQQYNEEGKSKIAQRTEETERNERQEGATTKIMVNTVSSKQMYYNNDNRRLRSCVSTVIPREKCQSILFRSYSAAVDCSGSQNNSSAIGGQTLDELTYSGMCSVGKELSRFSAEYCKQLWEVLLTILQPRASMREKKDIGRKPEPGVALLEQIGDRITVNQLVEALKSLHQWEICRILLSDPNILVSGLLDHEDTITESLNISTPNAKEHSRQTECLNDTPRSLNAGNIENNELIPVVVVEHKEFCGNAEPD